MKRKRYLITCFLILVGIGLGFFQEFIKINLNNMIETGREIPGFFDLDVSKKKAWTEYKMRNSPTNFYNSAGTLEVFYKMDEQSLIKTKWVLTGLFIALYFVLNASVLKFLTDFRHSTKWMIYFYSLFFIVALGTYLIGNTFSWTEKAYSISRKIVGGLESIVPSMILLPTIWLSAKMNKTTEQYEINE